VEGSETSSKLLDNQLVELTEELRSALTFAYVAKNFARRESVRRTKLAISCITLIEIFETVFTNWRKYITKHMSKIKSLALVSFGKIQQRKPKRFSRKFGMRLFKKSTINGKPRNYLTSRLTNTLSGFFYLRR
jgi:hypothetical protein